MEHEGVKITVDLVIWRNGKILLIRRKYPPFQDCLALPGGFVEADETVGQAACRELLEETNVTVSENDLKLIDVFSAPNRDPRGRVVSVAFLAVVPVDTKATAGDDVKDAVWVTLETCVAFELAFDHNEIIAEALALECK